MKLFLNLSITLSDLLHRRFTLYSHKAAVMDFFNSCYCLTSLTLYPFEAGSL